jgi:hypothetical protein
MAKFDKLTDVCKRLGYHGICPEALTELLDIQPELTSFMKDMRAMFAPVEDPAIAEQEKADAELYQRRADIGYRLEDGAISAARAAGLLMGTGMTDEQANARVDRILAGVQEA